MKTITFFTTIVVLLTLIFTSCSDTEKPFISLIELGYENTKSATAGSELHIEAEILAEGKIDVVRIEIHPEGEHEKKSFTFAEIDATWEFDTTYTEFSGLKNTLFHEHIKVPEDAAAGHYHFHFQVTDMEGYQSSFEEEIEILNGN